MRSLEFRVAPPHRGRALAQRKEPTSWLELGQAPPGRARALARHPPPVTPGLLDQRPGCCAEIPEHKRPHSGRGGDGDVGSPAPCSQGQSGPSEQGGPRIIRDCVAQRGHSRPWSQTTAGGGACGDTGAAGPWGPGPGLPLRDPSQLFPSLGLRFPGLCMTSSGSKTRLRGAVRP